VDDAGRTMKDIVEAVQRVTALIAEIAAASHEQSDGIGQVNAAIAQMDQAVQHNAALVDAAAAATESLNARAGELLAMVARFHLGDEAERSASVTGDGPRLAPVFRPVLGQPLQPAAG